MRKDYSILIVCLLVVAILIVFATPIGKPLAETIGDGIEYFFENLDDMTDHRRNKGNDEKQESTEEAETAFEYHYYGSLSAAIADVNDSTLGANAEESEAYAVVKAYVDKDENAVVVLLADIELSETLLLSNDVTINLDTYNITASGFAAVNVTDGKVTVASSGGSIAVGDGEGLSAILQTGGELSLLGVSLTVDSIGTACGVAVQEGAVLNMDNVTVRSKGTSTTYGVYAKGSFNIASSDIEALSDGAKSRALYLTSSAEGTVSSSDIKGLCTLYQATGTSSSQGISNSGKLTVIDCYAWGSHVGISNAGELVVNGGTYESPGHGGIYFGNINTPAYVGNAVLRYSAPPENSDTTADYNNCGFYIGGGSDRNNVVVYMDGCEIYGDSWAFTLRGSSGEQNNTLYISNSTVTGDGYVRVDNSTHALYIGAGNNFDASGVKDVNGNSMSDFVVTTEDVYKYDEASA